MDSLPVLEPDKRINVLNEVAVFLKNNQEYDGRALIDIAIANIPGKNVPKDIRRGYVFELRRLAEYANCDEEKKEEIQNIFKDSGIILTRDWFAPTSYNVLGVRVSMNRALGKTENRRSRMYKLFKDK